MSWKQDEPPPPPGPNSSVHALQLEAANTVWLQARKTAEAVDSIAGSKPDDPGSRRDARAKADEARVAEEQIQLKFPDLLMPRAASNVATELRDKAKRAQKRGSEIGFDEERHPDRPDLFPIGRTEAAS